MRFIQANAATGHGMQAGRVRWWLLVTASLAIAACSAVNTVPSPAPVSRAAPPAPWMDRTAAATQRAASLRDAMTLDEKLRVVMGYTDPILLALRGPWQVGPAMIAEVTRNQVPGSAGYVPGVERLHLSPQWQTDASIGVRVNGLARTALPSSLASAASFDPAVTLAGGRMIADEARRSGFNVFLAGGANLARDARNGRNFEYAGEDPLLAGVMVSGLIRGIQSRHMVSTMKHFAVNDQESQRTTLDARISTQAMHQSDLLAFEFILDWAHPGSVMCAYNRVNGDWACENDWLLNRVLKQEWGFDGYVMSDWGAVHTTGKSVNAGLDQMTGFPCCGDGHAYFGDPLRAALQAGTVPAGRLDDMAYRILLPLFATGAFDDPPVTAPIDFGASAAVAQSAAEQSLVLLKNADSALPLDGVRRIAVIGGHADKGVLSGGGSSGVTPVGGNAVPGLAPMFFPGPVVYLPSSPLAALQRAMPQAEVSFAEGDDAEAAVRLAASSDAAVIFVTQWMTEGFDGSLDLGAEQNRLVEAVAAANARTIVVVESGGAVAMPWLGKVKGVLEAFYPGAGGGEAIAGILSGSVNPSGHLPVTFPLAETQLAHALAGKDLPDHSEVAIHYDEGAALGYKWFDLSGQQPLFAFGHGLSYTSFDLQAPSVEPIGSGLRIAVTVKNSGKRAGAAVPQVYLEAPPSAGWESRKRLVAFAKVALQPGETRRVVMDADPRVLAVYNESRQAWTIAPGEYVVRLGQASDAIAQELRISLTGAAFSSRHLPGAAGVPRQWEPLLAAPLPVKAQ